MSDKKNVQLTDLAEKAPEEVKGGALSLNTDFASVNMTTSTNLIQAQQRISPQLDLSKVASTVMCPW